MARPQYVAREAFEMRTVLLTLSPAKARKKAEAVLKNHDVTSLFVKSF
jgi:hypothetical protein